MRDDVSARPLPHRAEKLVLHGGSWSTLGLMHTQARWGWPPGHSVYQGFQSVDSPHSDGTDLLQNTVGCFSY